MIVSVFKIPDISTEDEGHYTGDRFSARHHFLHLLEAELPEYKVTMGDYWHRKDDWSVHVSKKFEADKPSLIVSDEEAKKGMPTEDEIAQKVHACHQATLEAHTAHYQELRDIDLASWIMQSKRDELAKQAKLNVRMEQRLAALAAELEAEFNVLGRNAAAPLVEELKQDEDDGLPRWSKRTIELVHENLDAYLADHKPAVHSHFFRGTANRDAWLSKRLSQDDDA